MSNEDVKAWADDLRDKYGIPFAGIDEVTAEEEGDAAGQAFLALADRFPASWPPVITGLMEDLSVHPSH